MSLPDLLDQNSVGTDSHLQFLNWSIDNNGSMGLRRQHPRLHRRPRSPSTPTTTSPRATPSPPCPPSPTASTSTTPSSSASGQNVEFELRGGPGTHFNQLDRKGAVRVEGFVNHANMGIYREQNQLFLQGKTVTPDITAHPFQSTDQVRRRRQFRAGSLEQRPHLGPVRLERRPNTKVLRLHRDRPDHGRRRRLRHGEVRWRR